jgi:hypothetical protein
LHELPAGAFIRIAGGRLALAAPGALCVRFEGYDMRAEAESLISDIKQSMGLLRRHL